MSTTTAPRPATLPEPTTPVEDRRAVDRLGGVAVVVPVLLTALVLVAGALGRIPENMIGGLAVITGLGMLLGPLGNRLPGVSRVGGGALVCLMVPSLLVYLGFFSENTLAATSALMKQANFLYFVICTLVVGSIFGMRRSMMLSGLARIFAPLLVGTLAAVGVGTGVAMLFGYSFHRALFYLVVPIIGGGIGEGILPLSAAYSGALGGSAETYVAELIPAAVIGNIVAIILAGALRRLGERRPQLDGGGMLVRPRPASDRPAAATVQAQGAAGAASSVATVRGEHASPTSSAPTAYGMGVLVICSMFVLGTLAEPLVHLPAPVLVIVFSVILKVAGLVPESVEDSARAVYSIICGHFVYPLMIGLGMLYVPLDNVLKVLSLGYVVTCAAVVLTMAGAGFLVGRAIGMFPIDAALVTVCHSGLGGTGDVAILSASQRMVLMPFAQISTRIGGVTTVVAAASLIRLIS